MRYSRTQGPGDSVIVALRGDLDIAASTALRTCLDDTQDAHQTMIIDLSAVPFMDSSALAVIIGEWNKARHAGGCLALAGAQQRARRTLQITGVAGRLPLYDTVADAVAALSD